MATHTIVKGSTSITINGVVDNNHGPYKFSEDALNNRLIIKAENGDAGAEISLNTDTVTINGVSFTGTASELKTELEALFSPVTLSGTVNIAASGTSATVTNSLVKSTSIVVAVIRSNDTTALIKNVVPANGSFVIRLNAAATAETSIGYIVF